MATAHVQAIEANKDILKRKQIPNARNKKKYRATIRDC